MSKGLSFTKEELIAFREALNKLVLKKRSQFPQKGTGVLNYIKEGDNQNE